MDKIFVTFFGAGLLKPAPGTWGSIAGWIVGLAILMLAGEVTLFLCAALVFFVSLKIVDDYEKRTCSHDNSEIVIDEVVGVWIAMCVAAPVGEIFSLPLRELIAGFESSRISILSMILALLFFRAFDIRKPSIIGRVDRDVPGGLGVMLDDVLAGFFAGLGVLIVISLGVKFGAVGLIF
ncbi:phosphatidylglycerophosphatase A [uncultured Campylobacter sp.]|uniref:phosphatidylglycerophosphatase A family protein n=1 Tax=uncultured Campylobacter sp. TaxID=218934 RepID=UPI002620A45C|nr:phosphatidylglycerophosphatase A [uncultured Campylobacter sp.]